MGRGRGGSKVRSSKGKGTDPADLTTVVPAIVVEHTNNSGGSNVELEVLEERCADHTHGEAADAPETGMPQIVSRLCRGPGHIRRCEHCFYVDGCFGRNRRCKRACSTVDGIWGPTICCPECVAGEG